MSLRILDDDRPGFARLLFSARLDQPTLSLSIRSLRENAFLGPDGKWQRAAHYFTAERVGDSAHGTEYRVGPEIVNYLLEHDQILVDSKDGTLAEETRWENAVPQIPGSGAGHSIYRPPVSVVSTETRRGPEPSRGPTPDTGPVAPSKQIWPRFLPLAVIPLVLIALLAVPQLRCSLFGMSCPPPKDLLTPAMACAAERQASSPCDVKACFDSYLAETAPGQVAPKASTVIDRAQQACRKEAEERASRAAETDALQNARQCGASTNVCRAGTCYDGYMARYGNAGIFHDVARRELEALKARCPPPPPPPPAAAPSPPAPPLPVRPPDDRLTIPRNLDDLNGCWQSVRGDIQFFTDDSVHRPLGTVRMCYCLDGRGRGYARYRYSDGTKCIGALRAQLSQDRLYINHPEIKCVGNPAIGDVVGIDMVCADRPGEDTASCDINWHFRYPKDPTQDEKFHRVSREYCN